MLIRCGLVTSYGDRDRSQHIPRWWLVAWRWPTLTVAFKFVFKDLLILVKTHIFCDNFYTSKLTSSPISTVFHGIRASGYKIVAHKFRLSAEFDWQCSRLTTMTRTTEAQWGRVVAMLKGYEGCSYWTLVFQQRACEVSSPGIGRTLSASTTVLDLDDLESLLVGRSVLHAHTRRHRFQSARALRYWWEGLHCARVSHCTVSCTVQPLPSVP